MNFSTYIDIWNQRGNNSTEEFHHSTHSLLLSLNRHTFPTSTHWNSRTSSPSSFVFSFLECHINKSHSYSLLRLASSTQHNAFEIHPRWWGYQPFILFLVLGNVFHWMNVTQYIHSTPEGHMNCFQFCTIRKGAATNICVQVLLWI